MSSVSRSSTICLEGGRVVDTAHRPRLMTPSSRSRASSGAFGRRPSMDRRRARFMSRLVSLALGARGMLYDGRAARASKRASLPAARLQGGRRLRPQFGGRGKVSSSSVSFLMMSASPAAL